MKKRLIVISTAIIIVLSYIPYAACADVSQGVCKEYDKEKATITMEEFDLNFTKDHPYGLPTGKESIYDVSTALIGVKPSHGDILRIAYIEKNAMRIAKKVMNISKTDLNK